jgi:4-hydroxy-tetrahydrodipicolinate synthase
MKQVNLEGMISTVVTPFDENDQVNYALLRQDVRFLLDQGITAICACGSTGEGQTLSLEESAEICRVVVEEVDGRLPVIGGVIQNSTAQAIRYSLALKDAGVDVLQLTPVHYVFEPSSEETVEHFKRVADATDLPIIVYNVVPWALVQIETIEALSSVTNVVAVKQSGGDIHLLANLLHRVKDRFQILAALDNLHYPAFVMGAHGALAAIPTVTPQLSVELWNAVQEGNHDRALELHERVLTVWNAIDAPNLPATIKAALKLLGRDGGLPRQPFAPVTEEKRESIRQALVRAELIRE